jgi:uncharacterized membrane protein
MNRYSTFFYIGIIIIALTYLFIFLLPGNSLSTYFQSGYYFGIIPRIFPVFLIFGDVFLVAGLLFPATNFNKRRIYLVSVSSIFIAVGVLFALVLHVSPLNGSEDNGLKAGYLIVEGLVLLFFTLVLAHYISADIKITDKLIAQNGISGQQRDKNNR